MMAQLLRPDSAGDNIRTGGGAMADRTCPKCAGGLEEGFTLDHNYDQHQQAAWVEGQPQQSYWTGLKAPRAKQHSITTYRCTRCGYLESYAP
jgi:hypothetical protein